MCMEPRDERGTAGRLLPEGVRCAVRKISRDIVELARNANAELGRFGWSTFSNVLYGDYCSQPVQGHRAYSGHID